MARTLVPPRWLVRGPMVDWTQQLLPFVLLIGWFVLQAVVLPRAGVATWMAPPRRSTRRS